LLRSVADDRPWGRHPVGGVGGGFQGVLYGAAIEVETRDGWALSKIGLGLFALLGGDFDTV
jgi:hypothetical protein